MELFYWNRNNINSEDIVFETDNEVNESLAQKRSMIFEMLNSGLLENEDGKMSNAMRGKILEQLGMGIWETSHDLKNIQKNSAGRENLRLVDSFTIDSPLEIDDHDIHIEEHIAFLLGSNFEKKSAVNPKLKEKLLEHIKVHKTLKNLSKNEGE